MRTGEDVSDQNNVKYRVTELEEGNILFLRQ